MGVDRTVDMSGRNNAMVFQEDVLNVFQHVSAGAWSLPVDSYNLLGGGTIMCRASRDELTNWRR